MDQANRSSSSRPAGTFGGLQSMRDFITDDGLVDYEALKKDQTVLKNNLSQIRTADTSRMNTRDRMAFYLNAYNILAMNQAVESKRDLNWQGNTTWLNRRKFFSNKHEIEGQKMSLKQLQNDILSKFEDPRYHFATNGAALGYPRLPKELYDGENLDNQLEERSRDFVNRQGGVAVDDNGNLVRVSPIFKWYAKDFSRGTTRYKGVLPWIRRLWTGVPQIRDSARIKYQKFDWTLNGVTNPANPANKDTSPRRQKIKPKGKQRQVPA